MQDENGRLRKVLSEKDYEISYLKKKLDEERSALGLLLNLSFLRFTTKIKRAHTFTRLVRK